MADSPSSPPPAPPGNPPRPASDWWVFFVALLMPSVVMFLTGKSQTWQVITLTVLSGSAALFCGFWVSNRLFSGRSALLFWVVSVLCAGVFYAVSIVLCCVGCSLGGGKFDA